MSNGYTAGAKRLARQMRQGKVTMDAADIKRVMEWKAKQVLNNRKIRKLNF